MPSEEIQLFLHHAIVHVIRRFVPFRNHLTVRGSIVIDADHSQVCSIGFDDGIIPSSSPNDCKDGSDRRSLDASEELFFAGLFDSATNDINVGEKNGYYMSSKSTTRNVVDYFGDLDDEVIRIIGLASVDQNRNATKIQERKKGNVTDFYVGDEGNKSAGGICLTSKTCTSSDATHSDARRLWRGNGESAKVSSHPGGDCAKIKISPDTLMIKNSSIGKCERDTINRNGLMSRVITVKPLHGLRRLVADNDDNDEILNDNLESIDRRVEEEEEEDSVGYKRRGSRRSKKRRIMSSHLSRIIQSCDSESSFDSDGPQELDLKLSILSHENSSRNQNILNGDLVHFRRSRAYHGAKHIDGYQKQSAMSISPVLLQKHLENNLSSIVSLQMDSLTPVSIKPTISPPRISAATSLTGTSEAGSVIWTPNSCDNILSSGTSHQILRAASPYPMFTMISSSHISKTVSPAWVSTAISVERMKTSISPLEISTSISPIVLSTKVSPVRMSPAVSPGVSPEVLPTRVSPTVISPETLCTAVLSSADSLNMISTAHFPVQMSNTDPLSSISKSFELSPSSVAVALTTISAANSRSGGTNQGASSRSGSREHTVFSIVHTEDDINGGVNSVPESGMPYSIVDRALYKEKINKISTGHAHSKTEHRLNYKGLRQLLSKHNRKPSSNTSACRKTFNRCDNDDDHTNNELVPLNSHGIVQTPKRPSGEDKVNLSKGRVIRLRSVSTAEVDHDQTLDVVNTEKDETDAHGVSESWLSLSSILSSTSRDEEKRDRSRKRRSETHSRDVSPELGLSHQQLPIGSRSNGTNYVKFDRNTNKYLVFTKIVLFHFSAVSDALIFLNWQDGLESPG